jgi:type II secretory pathway pseudopilin PulG
MAAVDVAALTRQRANEQELLFVGDQYREAIRRYYFGAPPGTPRMLPASIDDLLEDDRYPTPVRHLRRRYPDPITASSEWGEVRIGNRLSGIYSLSEKQPVKQQGFTPAYEPFSDKTAYRDWVFAVSNTGRPNFVNPDSASNPANGEAPSIPSRPVRRTPP